MFMLLISQIPFSPDELKSECSGMEAVQSFSEEVKLLGRAVNRFNRTMNNFVR
jgi:hypothetical protein